MICPVCNSEIEGNPKFCPSCGAQLEFPNAANSGQYNQNTSYANTQNSQGYGYGGPGCNPGPAPNQGPGYHFCKHCGQPLTPGAPSCTNCGAPVGAGTYYCPNCGSPAAPGSAVCTSCGSILNPGAANPMNPPKSKLVAGLLGIFLGCFGVHNFYLGFTEKAVIQLILTIVGIPLSCIVIGVFMICGAAIWGLVEGIMILTGSIPADAKGVPLGD